MWFDFVPLRFLNVPHRQYWFGSTKDLHAASLVKLSNWLSGMGLLTAVFFAVLTELILRANLTSPIQIAMAPTLAAIAGFLITVLVWCVGFHSAFQPPKTHSS